MTGGEDALGRRPHEDALGDYELGVARRVAMAVPDPELPMVQIGDLGMIREVRREGEDIVVVFSPTYSGCPATELIQSDIVDALMQADFRARVEVSRTPAWSTDWITPAGRKKLRDAGISPPVARAKSHDALALFNERTVACPLCGSLETERLAEHGSTPCKALYRCLACREPFDHFKCH